MASGDDFALFCADSTPALVSAVAVGIDIKSESDTNPIHSFNSGLIPVAILGTDSVDVADVDMTTLAFGPRAPRRPTRRAATGST